MSFSSDSKTESVTERALPCIWKQWQKSLPK